MIMKLEYKTTNAVKTTMADGIDRIDSGVFDDGVEFINVFKCNRKNDDEFETIRIENLNCFIMENSGKTIQIFRSR